MTRASQASVQTYARVAGLLYLLLLPLGIFGIAVSSNLVVSADAAVTTRNIVASESLFRLSIVSALLLQIVNILVVLLLYQLLNPVNQAMAALMVIFLLAGVPIAMLNELNRFAVVVLLSGAHNLATLAADQSQAWVPVFLDLHALGIQIAGIFWGLWLLPMGYLVFKSGFLPRILGILMVIGGVGYLVDSFAAFLLPSFHVQIALFTFWGEVLLPLWLLIKGVNVARWEERGLASA